MFCGSIWGYFVKFHKNNLKMMGTMPLIAYCMTTMFCRYRYSVAAFDDINEQLASLEAEKERTQIIKLCLLGDYSMNSRALLSEVQYAKAPSDYIYSTLV